MEGHSCKMAMLISMATIPVKLIRYAWVVAGERSRESMDSTRTTVQLPTPSKMI